MSEKNKFILNNPCTEKWDSMEGNGCKRQCGICNTTVHDVTQVDLKTIAEEYMGSGKCVRMDNEQIAFFRYLRSISKIAGVSAALMFSTPSIAQSSQDSCVVSGKLRKKDAGRDVIIQTDEGRFKTQSDSLGNFSLTIPKNSSVKYTNIIKLSEQEIKEEHIHFRRAKLRPYRRVVGSF